VGDLIASIPGAAKAVAKLVGAGAEAGAAWVDVATAKGQQRAQDVRDVTAARSAVRDAMVDAAVKQIGADPDLGRRALEHFAQELVSGQCNREAVTKLALEYLAHDPPEETPKAAPSDDWLNFFSAYAERASGDRMREHWAAVLAGEIRKPGSVSALTMKMLSVIDTSTALLVEKYMRYALYDDISQTAAVPLIGAFGQEPYYDEILVLDAIGFITVGNHSTSNKEFSMSMYKLRSPSTIVVPAAVLTTAGMQLFHLLGSKPTLDDVLYIRSEIQVPFGSLEVVEAETGVILFAYGQKHSSSKQLAAPADEEANAK
jgi:hypothetical protein